MKQFLAILVLASAATVLSAQESSPFAGGWKIHTNIMGNENDLVCTFALKGTDLTGTCKGEQGSLAITGKVDDKNVKFQFSTDYNGDTLTVAYTGTLDATPKIAGTVNVQPFGVDGEFTAVPSK